MLSANKQIEQSWQNNNLHGGETSIYLYCLSSAVVGGGAYLLWSSDKRKVEHPGQIAIPSQRRQQKSHTHKGQKRFCELTRQRWKSLEGVHRVKSSIKLTVFQRINIIYKLDSSVLAWGNFVYLVFELWQLAFLSVIRGLLKYSWISASSLLWSLLLWIPRAHCNQSRKTLKEMFVHQ